jgi:hypothetical protein
MANGRDTREIKRIRNEILVALKVIYPGALQAEGLMRSLLALFPTLEFDHLKRDLHYLVEKGYIERVRAAEESDNGLTPWRRRWFRLSTRGMELADRCIKDPALEE